MSRRIFCLTARASALRADARSLRRLACRLAAGLLLLSPAIRAECRTAAWQHPEEPSAFSFDPRGRDRVLIHQMPGTARPILPAEVDALYGRSEGFSVLARTWIRGEERSLDVCSEGYAAARRFRGPLRPTFQDLSDAAGWPRIHVRPGVLALDPRHARFKFYEGYRGDIALVRQVPTPHGNPFGLAGRGDYLFLGMGESAHGMLVIDAANPAEMKVVADAPRRGPWILDVQAAGDLAFSSDAGYLNIYDVSDPRKPEVLSHFPCGAKYIGVDSQARTVYFHAADHLITYRVDISDPRHPKMLPPWPRKFKKEVSCWVLPHGSYAYAWVSAPLNPEEERPEDKPADPASAAASGPTTPSSAEEPAPALSPSHEETDAEILDALADDRTREQQKKFKELQAERASVSSKEGFYQVTRIYDRSRDPIEPQLLGETSPGQVLLHIVERGGRTYALGRCPSSSLAVYDLADPVRPKLIAAHPGIPGSWTLSGDHLYAIAGIPDGRDGGLYVYEFPDLLAPPRLVGRLNTFDRRYMEHRSSWGSLWVRGDTLFTTDYFYGVVAMDVSQKDRPRIAGGLHTAGEAFCLDVSDSRVFIGENMGGLTILDNSVPEEARIAGNFGIGGGWGVCAQGNLAFCANLAGLMIVDTADPRNPIELSYSDGIYNALAVKVRGPYAYCMGNGGYGDIFDITDLRKPVRLGRFQTRRAFQFDVHGDWLFIADHHEGLVIFDISDRRQPRRAATFYHGGGAGSVSVKGDVAFVGGPPGLQVLDVSDPKEPFLMAESASATGGVVVGDFIYATAYFGAHKLSVTDISDPQQPKFLQGFNPGYYSYSTQCAVHGEYLYLTSLPYLSICRVPMSAETPPEGASVQAATATAREGPSPGMQASPLATEILRHLPSQAQPPEGDAASLHDLLTRLQQEDEGPDGPRRALSEISARLLGLEVSVDAPQPVVPGYPSLVRAAFRNAGQRPFTLQSASLASPHEEVAVSTVRTPANARLEPGTSAEAEFSVRPGANLKPGEDLPFFVQWTHEFGGVRASGEQHRRIRLQPMLAVRERIPKLEVSNLDPCSFRFSVGNQTPEELSVRASLEMPPGWTAAPGPQQALVIPSGQTRDFQFALRLPDAEAALGAAGVPLRVSARDAVHFQKEIGASAARRMRWRVIGPFGYDITSEERPIPEREVDFGKTYAQGQLSWKPYVCAETISIDLCQPPPGGPGGPNVVFYYGATYIRSDRDQEVKFSLSGNPAILSGPRELRGWLNGQHAIGSSPDRPTLQVVELSPEPQNPEEKDPSLQVEDDLDAEKPKPLVLRKGWNLLLIRSCWINNYHFEGHWVTTTPQWPFRLALHDPQGNPIRNLTLDSEQH
ncbi:MAG: hypothetical protein HYU36_13955 [Planctomycetes bacterium]|nr:hypothetical protein [Planctomycetota bacterium]